MVSGDSGTLYEHPLPQLQSFKGTLCLFIYSRLNALHGIVNLCGNNHISNYSNSSTHLVVVQNDESDLGPRPVADLHQLTVGAHRGVAALHAAVLRRLLGPGPGAGGGVVAVQGGPNELYSGN